jgi:hypothetical protein
MNSTLKGTLLLAAAALLAAPAAATADAQTGIEQARPAVYTAESGADVAAQSVQYVSTPWGSTWYGANSYAYAPTSYYVAPTYGYYGGYGYDPYDYGVSYRTSFYAPTASTYTSYRPYYVSHGAAGYSYGWLPYSYQTAPYGSFYRYYGPAYGSGFHMWFGY